MRDELVERCRQGHKPSYEALYRQYAKAMFNTSLRILNNRTDAEDVLQDAFLDAFRSLSDFEYRSTFGAWLKRIVVNKSINLLRKRKLDWVELDDQVPATEESDRPDEGQDEISWKVEEVKKAIQALPDGYRTVLSLYLLEGYDQEEIAGIMGISHNTVRTQYTRGKQRLLRELKEGGIT